MIALSRVQALLNDPSDPTGLETLEVPEKAELFALAAFTSAALPVLAEYLWLHRASPADLGLFHESAFQHELAPLRFSQESLMRATKRELETRAKLAQNLAARIVASAKKETPGLHDFCLHTIESVEAILKYERGIEANFLANALDRAFETMDELFGIRFEGERSVNARAGSERTFVGSTIGVQSSYTSLLQSLAQLQPLNGATLIDLGSGYGRAGLVIGLLRPDMKFIGYEYIEHRNDIADASARSMGLGEHIEFLTQDLADPGFKIPLAQIYYLYDPFTKETYASVLAQLKAIGGAHVITVATRGHATAWVTEAFGSKGWSISTGSDEGKLSLFTSHADA